MNITAQFEFDARAFDAAVDRASDAWMQGLGEAVKEEAVGMIRTGGEDETSLPGSPPVGHLGEIRYRDTITVSIDRARKTVVVGAVRLPRRDSNIIPELLEFGGVMTVVRRDPLTGQMVQQTFRVEARPHMRPAIKRAVDKHLDRLMRNSITN